MFYILFVLLDLLIVCYDLQARAKARATVRRCVKRKLQTINKSSNAEKKCKRAQFMEYKPSDLKEGLRALINGKSRRAAAELSGVPASSLKRHYEALTGKKPNVKQPLNKKDRREALDKLKHFEPKRLGQARRLFTHDEEILMVEMLEAAAKCAFPYNADALEATALNLGKAAYGKEFTLGKRGKWRKGFDKRHKERIFKVKSGSICQRRASSATVKVRDAVYHNFIFFLNELVSRGELTEAQRNNLGNHIINADEVGGDERGKRKKVYTSRNAAWRSTTRDGDNNPFHVTLMLVTMACGIIMNAISLIHSAPGSKVPRMRADLHTNIPETWHVRRTVSGSMTRELFQDWAVCWHLLSCIVVVCCLPRWHGHVSLVCRLFCWCVG